MMKNEFDPQAHAIYVHFRDGVVNDTVQASKDVYVDVDAEGAPLGLEILFASRVLDVENAGRVSVSVESPVLLGNT
ncbi:MAG: DUF2283 domain-containing protein [Chloroflexi bacterium]|nr:DUF2283 domain-containing protein [Chloroflexota bacterium]